MKLGGRGAGEIKKAKKNVNVVCEGPSVTYLLVESIGNSVLCVTSERYDTLFRVLMYIWTLEGNLLTCFPLFIGMCLHCGRCHSCA